MKVKTILSILIFCSFESYSYNENKKTLDQDSVQLIEIIKNIEKKSPKRFYFKYQWIKDIYYVPDKTKNTTTIELINFLKNETEISIYEVDDKVYLLKDARIISNPTITKNFNRPKDIPIVDEQISFKKEYDLGQKKLEEEVQYVGKAHLGNKNENSTVAGYVREKGTNDPVEGAFIYIESPFIGSSTDENGFYSLSVPNGQRRLFVQSVNMKNSSRKLVVFSDGKLDINLEVDVIALEAVTIHAQREENIKSPQMGLAKITHENLKIVPSLLGEKDLIRVATTTVGVQNVGEGAAGINIRGGKADQNLFLLDGATLFNTNHFFGFFSVFNSDAIEELQIYKSGIPAEYGGRLSSVFDVISKIPSEKLSTSGGIGPITSKILIEGPIAKKGPSFILSGRATYSDYVLSKIKNSPIRNNEAAFYDIMAKVKHDFNENNELSVTGYYSYDQFQLSSDTLLTYTDFSYSNRLISVNWKHIFNDKLQANFKASSSTYAYNIGFDFLPSQAFDIKFSINEKTLATKFDCYVNESLNYKFGIEAKYNRTSPGEKYAKGKESLIADDQLPIEKGMELAPYFSAVYSPSEKLSLDIGIRYSLYAALGPANVNVYSTDAPKDINSIVKIESFDNGEIIKPIHHGPEYRISSRYSLNKTSSIKIGINRTRQNNHLLLNSASIAPTNVWRLSGRHIKTQISDQASLGYYKNIYGKQTLEFSSEVYVKKIQNLLDFKVGADLQFNRAVETDLLQGDGKTYGLELSLKKSSGWLTGWLNYTYSKSLIRLSGIFPEETINGGSFFPTGYDKPHYINSVTNYKITRRFTATLNFVYATGVPATIPEGKWDFHGSENLLYSERNAHRIPDYFRMDIGINLEGNHKKNKLAHSSWSFSVYNVLSRANVYSVFFRVEDGEVNGYKMSVFADPVPTLTYNFKF